MSETIRVSRETKEALLRVAANLQARLGRRIDFDAAISHLVESEGGNPDSFAKFVGSVRGIMRRDLLGELAEERARDELRSKRKYGV